jgi:hypothetical protein
VRRFAAACLLLACLLLALPAGQAAENPDCDPSAASLDPACLAESRGPSVYDEERVRYVAYGEGFAYALAGTAKAGATRKQRNKHAPGEMDEIVTEKLSGVEIAWLHPAAKKKERLLYSLSISRRAARVPLFRIGKTTESEIVGLLGPPASSEKNALRYDVPNQAGADVLVFHLRKGRLQRVYWEWFLD